MKETDIEHNTVYYSPEFDELFVGRVTLNMWGSFGGTFWTQTLSPYNEKIYKKCFKGLIKIGDL